MQSSRTTTPYRSTPTNPIQPSHTTEDGFSPLQNRLIGLHSSRSDRFKREYLLEGAGGTVLWVGTKRSRAILTWMGITTLLALWDVKSHPVPPATATAWGPVKGAATAEGVRTQDSLQGRGYREISVEILFSSGTEINRGEENERRRDIGWRPNILSGVLLSHGTSIPHQAYIQSYGRGTLVAAREVLDLRD